MGGVRYAHDMGHGRIDSDEPRWIDPTGEQWTPVDTFEVEGKRLVVLARPDADDDAPEKPFTTREREVLVLAAQGTSNKQIAFELGVSAATVRVLMARAAQKLGVRRRADAIERFLLRRTISDAEKP